MININYLYSFIVLLPIGLLLYFTQNFRPNKHSLNNKILLKNLLEGLDLDIPEELKGLDSSTNDPQKLS